MLFVKIAVEDVTEVFTFNEPVISTSLWPLIGVGAVNRNTIFGTVCQMPDGRWVEYKGKQ